MNDIRLLRLPLEINGEPYGEIEVYEDMIDLVPGIFVLDTFDQPIKCSVTASNGTAVMLPGKIIRHEEGVS